MLILTATVLPLTMREIPPSWSNIVASAERTWGLYSMHFATATGEAGGVAEPKMSRGARARPAIAAPNPWMNSRRLACLFIAHPIQGSETIEPIVCQVRDKSNGNRAKAGRKRNAGSEESRGKPCRGGESSTPASGEFAASQ